MPTLVLSQRFHGDSADLQRAAWGRGWNTHRAIRFLGPDGPSDCCLYGEILFCDIMAERLGLGLLDPPDDWLARLPYEARRRDVSFCRARDLAKFNERLFFKPANDKVFQYGVYERGTDVPLRYVDHECPCLVSEVVSFDLEVRLYVLDQQIKTLEYYRLVGEHEEQDVRDAARAFGESVLVQHGHELPSAVVLDVGHIEGRGWAVVEANQAYASGIYGEANLNEILDVVYRSSGPLANVSDSDRKFLRNKENP